jgi:hypothetical protein
MSQSQVREHVGALDQREKGVDACGQSRLERFPATAASGPKPDYEKALGIADKAASLNPHGLSERDLDTARFGVQSVLTRDPSGLQYFSAVLGNMDPDRARSTFATFSDALAKVNIHAEGSIPEQGDFKIGFSRLVDGRKDVAELVHFDNKGRVEALNKVLPPKDPFGPQSAESDSPRRAEDVLESVVSNALLKCSAKH